ncbi:hypothetical protein B0H12DRAFT_957751, partial [Mycena haematopus]
DLKNYFIHLEKADRLPNLETILNDATTLVGRYASHAAFQNSLRASEATSADNMNRVPTGSPWVARGGSGVISRETGESVDSEMPETGKESTAAPKLHQERPGFTGDRVLRNSQVFLLEFGWWIEMAWAVPEGDIGRVWEIMKIWIFKFAGSSHQNYMKYLLEVYCLLRYESSPGLSDAILDNWLVRVKKELGKYLPGDLHQEHYNRWLQDIELHLLLALFKEEEVHLFREGRSMGHAAVNQFSRGCLQLDKGKLADFISSTTCLGDFF